MVLRAVCMMRKREIDWFYKQVGFCPPDVPFRASLAVVGLSGFRFKGCREVGSWKSRVQMYVTDWAIRCGRANRIFRRFFLKVLRCTNLLRKGELIQFNIVPDLVVQQKRTVFKDNEPLWPREYK
jgi:hypothetical protein